MGAKKLNLESLIDLDLDFGSHWVEQRPVEQADTTWRQSVTQSIVNQQRQQKNVLWQAYIKAETADRATNFCKEHHLSKSELTRILFENFFKKN